VYLGVLAEIGAGGVRRVVETPLTDSELAALKEAAEAVRAQAADLMREGIAQAEAEPPADPSLLFEHAYVDPPASFQRELAELKRILGA